MSTIDISITFVAILLVINCDLEIMRLSDNAAAATAGELFVSCSVMSSCLQPQGL